MTNTIASGASMNSHFSGLTNMRVAEARQIEAADLAATRASDGSIGRRRHETPSAARPVMARPIVM